MCSLDLKVPNAEEILSLIEEFSDLSYPQIQQKLNRYIQCTTNTKLSFLVPILTESKEMVINVLGEQILDRELRFPVLNNSLFETVESRNVTELNEELLRHLQLMVHPMPTSILVIPIQHPKQQRIALVVSLVDYDDEKETTRKCVEVVQKSFRFCLGSLLNAFKCYEESKLKRQCEDLLAVSWKLFTHLGDLSDLLREIMEEIKKLTKAERCLLFLLDPDKKYLVAKVLDGIAMKEELKIPIGQGIESEVLYGGELYNVRNAYEHPRFYPWMDDVTGFKTRNILCFPIRDENGIIGVAQLSNKKDGSYFDVFDEELVTAFSNYCGISIMNSIVYKKMQDAQARNKLINEIMIYHMKVEEEVVQSLLNCKDAHDIKDFHEFHFSPRSVPYEHMACYTIKMFNDLCLFKHWKMKMSTLARFILYVQKGYRDAPYHNWVHAFSVAHFAYLLIRNLKLITENYMTRLQALIFLVSCLCHDIDHRGTNNSFQTKCSTVLASLYSSEGSVMEFLQNLKIFLSNLPRHECNSISYGKGLNRKFKISRHMMRRHHLAQTMCILSTEGCNIFENFNSKEYSEALDLLRNNILATDLASHFRAMERHKEMIRNRYNKNDPKQRKHLFDMLMTCCDLSDQTKHWKVSKKTAELIYDEFFSQGDLEKSMGSSPIEMMDRERASIPDLQEQFIVNIVLPLFTNLSKLFPVVNPLVHVLQENRSLWEVSKAVFQKYTERGMKGMEILLSPNFEEEVLQVYAQRRSQSSTDPRHNLEVK